MGGQWVVNGWSMGGQWMVNASALLSVPGITKVMRLTPRFSTGPTAKLCNKHVIWVVNGWSMGGQ
jgi:hypothetical protein